MNRKVLTLVLTLVAVVSVSANLYLGILAQKQSSLVEYQNQILDDAVKTLLEAKQLINYQQGYSESLEKKIGYLESRLEKYEPVTDGLAKVKYDYNVYVTLKRNGETVSYEETHNVFTDAGKNYVKQALGNAEFGATAFKYVAVGNGTAPASGSTTLNSEIAESGLTRASGTYTSTGTGAWKIEKVFSVTGTVGSVNSTGLFNASATGTMIAGDTFSNTNVASGDSLNITWTISVS